MVQDFLKKLILRVNCYVLKETLRQTQRKTGREGRKVKRFVLNQTTNHGQANRRSKP